MKDHIEHGPHHIETNTDPAAFAHWPPGLYEEMIAGHDNGCVGLCLCPKPIGCGFGICTFYQDRAAVFTGM